MIAPRCTSRPSLYTRVVELLLADENIDVNGDDDTPHQPQEGHSEIVESLLATKKVDVNAKDSVRARHYIRRPFGVTFE